MESPSSSVELSILIVTHDSRDHIRGCLDSIRRAAANLAHEVILIDNASQDGTPDLVHREFPEVRLIRSANNRGMGHGINQGAAQSRGRYLLLLNPDTLLKPDTLTTLLQEIRQSPGTGLLGCRLVHGDGSLQQSFGYEINIVNLVVQKLLFNLWEKRRFAPMGWWLNRLHTHRREADWIKGACMLVCRQALFDAELMDDTFFMYLEDADLCRRIRQLGWKIRYTPAAEVIHFGGGSSRSNKQLCALEYRKSQYHYFQKYLGGASLNLLRIYLGIKMRKDLLVAQVLKWAGIFTPQQFLEETQRLRDVLSLIRESRCTEQE